MLRPPSATLRKLLAQNLFDSANARVHHGQRVGVALAHGTVSDAVLLEHLVEDAPKFGAAPNFSHEGLKGLGDRLGRLVGEGLGPGAARQHIRDDELHARPSFCFASAVDLPFVVKAQKPAASPGIRQTGGPRRA
jgi:hypothetical protein